MPPLSEEIIPYVLDDTPPVLSVGLRCRQYGYEFHWFPHKTPYMVTPDGNKLVLEVIDDLPYINMNAKPQPFEKEETYPGWYHSTYRFPQDTQRPTVQ